MKLVYNNWSEMESFWFLKMFGIFTIIWAKAECNLFADPLAPILYENQEVRYIDLPATTKATQNISIRLDIPYLLQKTARIKLLLDPVVWGKPVKVQHALNHKQPSSELDIITTFVHNVAIVDYHTRIGSPLNNNVKELLRKNYHAVLKYRRRDGSFGTPKSRVFLTTFITKGLQVAKRYISIHKTNLNDAQKWIAKQQQSDGQFFEAESMLHEKMRGPKLAAYVLTIFATGNLSYEYPEVVQKATEYIAKRTEQMDEYELALASYALSLVGHPKGKYCLEQLLHPKSTGNQPNAYWRGKSFGAEIGGYALMASLNHTVYTSMENIVQWLKSRPFGSHRGFRHTQGVATALMALAQHHEKFSQYINNYTIQLQYQSSIKFLYATPTDSRMYEMVLPSNTKLVQAEIDGTGFGRLEIAYQYNQKVSGIEASFALNVELLNSTTKEIQNLQVCIASHTNKTEGLTLMEVFFPKGFSGMSVEDLSPQKSIWKTLQRSEGTSTVVYFESLGPAMNCFVVTAELFQASIAKSTDDAPQQMDVVAYDYYNRDRVAWVSYKGYRQHDNEDDYEYLETV